MGKKEDDIIAEGMLRDMELNDQRRLQAQQDEEINRIMRQQAATSSLPMMGGNPKGNLIEWELSVNDLTDDIKRLLGSEIEVEDENGNRKWVKNPVKYEPFLNDDGVRDVLYTVHSLLNRNTILSNLNVEEINVRVRMLSNELRTLIYCNYENYDIDKGTDMQVQRKMNHYSMIILDLDSMIFCCFRRALNGQAHTALNEQRIVSQVDNTNNNNNYGGQYPQQQQGQNKKAGSKLWPWNWGTI